MADDEYVDSESDYDQHGRVMSVRCKKQARRVAACRNDDDDDIDGDERNTQCGKQDFLNSNKPGQTFLSANRFSQTNAHSSIITAALPDATVLKDSSIIDAIQSVQQHFSFAAAGIAVRSNTKHHCHTDKLSPPFDTCTQHQRLCEEENTHRNTGFVLSLTAPLSSTLSAAAPLAATPFAFVAKPEVTSKVEKNDVKSTLTDSLTATDFSRAFSVTDYTENMVSEDDHELRLHGTLRVEQVTARIADDWWLASLRVLEIVDTSISWVDWSHILSVCKHESGWQLESFTMTDQFFPTRAFMSSQSTSSASTSQQWSLDSHRRLYDNLLGWFAKCPRMHRLRLEERWLDAWWTVQDHCSFRAALSLSSSSSQHSVLHDWPLPCLSRQISSLPHAYWTNRQRASCLRELCAISDYKKTGLPGKALVLMTNYLYGGDPKSTATHQDTDCIKDAQQLDMWTRLICAMCMDGQANPQILQDGIVTANSNAPVKSVQHLAHLIMAFMFGKTTILPLSVIATQHRNTHALTMPGNLLQIE